MVKSILLSKYFDIKKLTKKYVLKILVTVNKIKAPVGFELITNILVVNALTHCAALLEHNFRKENSFKVIPVLNLILFFSIKSTSQHKGVPYELKGI